MNTYKCLSLLRLFSVLLIHHIVQSCLHKAALQFIFILDVRTLYIQNLIQDCPLQKHWTLGFVDQAGS